MQDVEHFLNDKEISLACPTHVLFRDILYADDTVLMGSNVHEVQEFLKAVVECGFKYGLELSWSKTHAINIKTEELLYDPLRNSLVIKAQTMYLGSSIRADGNHSIKVSRQIAEAHDVFHKLESF